MNTTIKFGKTIFHLSGGLEASRGEQQADILNKHFNQTAEALSWTQEKFELKRKELLKRLETIKSRGTEGRLASEPSVECNEQKLYYNITSLTRLGCSKFMDQLKSNLPTGLIDRRPINIKLPLQYGPSLTAHQL